MKRFILTTIWFSLMLVFVQTFAAQATSQPQAEKSLSALKKSLAKNSRYGDEVIYWFNPVNFKGCEVSYRFSRLNENTADRFSVVNVDRLSPLVRSNTVRNQDLPEKPSMAQQKNSPQQTSNTNSSQISARAKVFYNNSFPYYYYGIDRRAFFLEQVVTSIDLSLIDAGSIQVKTSPTGQEYLVFNALKNQAAIEKRLYGSEKDTFEVESDFVPVSDKKGGDKISAAFIEAVNACRR